jgi:lipopolysaccharide biosynthesis glycosyltransferase
MIRSLKETTVNQEFIYCTYFDSKYLPQGIVMARSLNRHNPFSKIYILCLDDFTFEYLSALNLPNVFLVLLTEIEEFFSVLSPLKHNRSTIDYYFTLTPFLINYVNNISNTFNKWVIYLDADLYFFESFDSLNPSLLGHDVAIIPHNFNRKVESRLIKYGIFNVGYVGFFFDKQFNQCLDFWQKSCQTWCSDIVNGTAYADQGYLNDFHIYANNLYIIYDVGYNFAPWNSNDKDIKTQAGVIYVDNSKLVFFHFHGLYRIGKFFGTSHPLYRTKLTKELINFIYTPYLKQIIEIQETLSATDSSINFKGLKRGHKSKMYLNHLKRILLLFTSISTRKFIKINF